MSHSPALFGPPRMTPTWCGHTTTAPTCGPPAFEPTLAPVARQIEPWIAGTEHATHIGAAPRAAVAGVMPAVGGRLEGVMLIIAMRRQRRRIQTGKRNRRDK